MIAVLRRINAALEWLTPLTSASAACVREARACVWHPQKRKILAAQGIGFIDLTLLKGIDRQANTLLENTRRFARGLPANNALLWGARGTGKSSLVKAVHARINEEQPDALALVEIRRDDISTLPQLLDLLRHVDQRCLLFCDDLSFDEHDGSYRSLKTVLEGGIEGRPENVLFYATSNRRHLMPREMIEVARSTAMNPAEAVEEQVSLSDRFGLWLGFHACDQSTYLEIVEGYAFHYQLNLPLSQLRSEAIEWSMARGARSGRVAWQFIQDLAGRLGKRLEPSPAVDTTLQLSEPRESMHDRLQAAWSDRPRSFLGAFGNEAAARRHHLSFPP